MIKPRTIPPQNAATKLATRNPGTNADASSIISALMTNQNNPRVSRVRGKVMTFKKIPNVFDRPYDFDQPMPYRNTDNVVAPYPEYGAVVMAQPAGAGA